MKGGKKIVTVLLIGLLMAVMLVPAAAAADKQVSLVFNGQEYQADLFVKNGVSYISAASLAKIPGLALEEVEEEYVPLRSFFESREGSVGWDNRDQKVIVSWREKNGDWFANDLVVESSNLLYEKNTYKMKGSATIKMSIAGTGEDEIPEVPEITSIMEGIFQQEPLAVYIKQTMALPPELSGQDMDLTEEEATLLGGEMSTEMLWTENKIYQKNPLVADQWIVQELAGMDIMGNLTEMLQTSPQQALKMMSKFGVFNVFGDDIEIDGQEYYTISNYIDSATFKKILSEFLTGFDLGGLLAGLEGTTGQDEAATADAMTEFEQVLEQLLATIEIDYYVNSFINKETLLTERMEFNMEMKYELDETISPEGAISFEMAMSGDFELYDFGEEVQMPDVSDAITQQELMEQMMNLMETPEEKEIDGN